jgi:hypothetical protein
VQQWYYPDYTINRTTGFNGSSSSLQLTAMAESDAAGFYAFSMQQPLVPMVRVIVWTSFSCFRTACGPFSVYQPCAFTLQMANTSYTFTAWLLPVASNASTSVTAYLRCDSFEADDFNVQVGYTSLSCNCRWIQNLSLFACFPFAQVRDIQRNSSSIKTPAVDWAQLTLTFVTPAWDGYADLRFMAVGSGLLFVDDYYFGLTALAPVPTASTIDREPLQSIVL